MIVFDQSIIVLIRSNGAVAHHHFQPIVTVRHAHVGQAHAASLFPKRPIRHRDAPLGGTVNVVFFHRLPCVKRLNGIGVVMAQHTGRVDAVGPSMFLKRFHGSVVPEPGFFRSAAPVVLLDVQDVIAKIAKLHIGVLSAFEIGGVVFEEQTPPARSVFTANLLKRIESQFMMGAATVGRIDDAKIEDSSHVLRSVDSVQRAGSVMKTLMENNGWL